ncbi:MAG: hypothetical protein WKG07_29425 [Hymenobacter sp.]
MGLPSWWADERHARAADAPAVAACAGRGVVLFCPSPAWRPAGRMQTAQCRQR